MQFTGYRNAEPRQMPDVQGELRPDQAGRLDWVGMGAIELPLLLAAADGSSVQTPALVDASVNLTRSDARGIHMSRLYLHLDRRLSHEPLTPRSLHGLLRDFLDSHDGLSDAAQLRLRFDWMLRRRALVSDKSGWRRYPVIISASHERGHYALELATEVLYSSTCPGSAALSQQLAQEQFQRDFGNSGTVDVHAVQQWLGSERGLAATPHSQRSRAQVRVRLLPSFQDFPITDLIDALEQALQTPVQSAVKREDEQAFAALNAANLMFCEDAARRLRSELDREVRYCDYWLRVTHQESLHPHDAVACVSKGVDGGYGAHSGWIA